MASARHAHRVKARLGARRSFAGYAACLSRPDRIDRFMPRGGVTLWSASGAPIGLWLRPWIVLSIQMQRRNEEARASVVTARPKLERAHARPKPRPRRRCPADAVSHAG